MLIEMKARALVLFLSLTAAIAVSPTAMQAALIDDFDTDFSTPNLFGT